MDTTKKYKEIESTINIEAVEISFTIHNFVMPKLSAKPKRVGNIDAGFGGFTDKERTGISRDIYSAGDYRFKVYRVNLRGDMSWNEYYKYLKEIQPDIKIVEVFTTTHKTFKAKNPFFKILSTK